MSPIGKKQVSLYARPSLFHKAHQGSYFIISLGYRSNINIFEKVSYL